MLRRPTGVALAVLAMAAVVVASNILVQFPVEGRLGQLALADLLTWGAFTYPLAFLVTDLANRSYGPRVARRVVYAGFAAAVLCSLLVPPLLAQLGLVPQAAEGSRLARIAAASGLAFLAAQLLDVTVFNALRAGSWWRAPAVSSVLGSVLDTAVFFSLAFAAFAAFLGPADGFAAEPAPLLGLFNVEAARWVSWALGDLGVKLLIAAIALIPYRMAMAYLMPWRPQAAS